MPNKNLELFFQSLEDLPTLQQAFKLNFIQLLILKKIKKNNLSRADLVQEPFMSKLSLAQRYRYINQLIDEGFILYQDNFLKLKD
jgi:hypothetical protein